MSGDIRSSDSEDLTDSSGNVRVANGSTRTKAKSGNSALAATTTTATSGGGAVNQRKRGNNSNANNHTADATTAAK